jgi:hypothetical protein
MQITTRTRSLSDGQPFAATINAPSANGSAKIVCEKRINRRNRDTGPPSPLPSPCRYRVSTTTNCRGGLFAAAMFLQKTAKKTKIGFRLGTQACTSTGRRWIGFSEDDAKTNRQRRKFPLPAASVTPKSQAAKPHLFPQPWNAAFTACLRPLAAVQVCSFQSGHSLFGFALPAVSALL